MYTKTPFIKTLGLLIELHDMMKAGDGDSVDADCLRDQMDTWWYSLTDEEQMLVGHTSEALYNRDGM